jgi:hypothetical protein
MCPVTGHDGGGVIQVCVRDIASLIFVAQKLTQLPQRDHLAGPEVRLEVLGHGAQLLIDVVEQGGDTLHSGHGLLRARQGFTLLTSVEEVHDQCKVPSEDSWFANDEHHR